jgi:hypothetical protein
VSRVLVRLVLVATLAAIVAAALDSGLRQNSVEENVSRYEMELKEIATTAPIPAGGGEDVAQTVPRTLTAIKSQVATVEGIAGMAQRDLSAQASGCRFAKAAGSKMPTEIGPARAAIKRNLDALASAVGERLHRVTAENTALGWVGWRGSRQVEIYRLAVIAHDISMTAARADLAFARLKTTFAPLNRVAATCR